ncbi:HU family DNA-binding protein [Neolewinella aquimaris]|nr:HU family DNA-binding protein [Neolewinella aquimaris]
MPYFNLSKSRLMNKGDLVSAIADKASLTKDQAESALTAMLGAIEDALKQEDSVSLIGFGTFSVNNRPAREGRNPRTNETIQIAAKNVVKFKPGKKLSESVN